METPLELSNKGYVIEKFFGLSVLNCLSLKTLIMFVPECDFIS